MGISYLDAKVLWNAKLNGVSFERTATLGRLSLLLHPGEIDEFGVSHLPTVVAESMEFGRHSDQFFKDFLGANTVEAIDYSAYEGASIVHDMNCPVPHELCGLFDAVVDGGALEHIFNFPVAIANVLKLPKVGGSVFITTPMNNLCGHGFYQFSPELMFRVFNEKNGYMLKRVLCFEARYPSVDLSRNRAIYEIADPAQVGSRVGLISMNPVVMIVEARKVADVPLFSPAPMQSDYETVWREGVARPEMAGLKRHLRSIFAKLPFAIRARISGFLQRQRFSLSNERFYRRLR